MRWVPKFSPNLHWVSTGVYTCKTGRCKFPKELQSPHTRPFVQLLFVTSIPSPSVAMFDGLGFVKALKLSPYDLYHLVASTMKQLCGGKVGKMQIPKRKAKVGLSCKLQALWIVIELWPSISFPFLYFFTFHQIPIVFQLVTLWAFVFSPPTEPPLFACFGGEKLWTFNKFCMGSSSLVMKSINLLPNEKMVQIFVGHDNIINVDNL